MRKAYSFFGEVACRSLLLPGREGSGHGGPPDAAAVGAGGSVRVHGGRAGSRGDEGTGRDAAGRVGACMRWPARRARRR